MIEIGRNEAIDALRAAAWTVPDEDKTTCGHPGCTDHPVLWTGIHTQMGGFGADWDLDAAVAAIETCEVVGWRWSLMGHDLAVEQPDGKVVRMAVEMPPEVRVEVERQMKAARQAAS